MLYDSYSRSLYFAFLLRAMFVFNETYMPVPSVPTETTVSDLTIIFQNRWGYIISQNLLRALTKP